MRADDIGGHIYLIQEQGGAGCVKVGLTTRDPDRRVAQLQTGNPNPLEIFAVWDVHKAWCLKALEQRVHEALEDWHVMGEWFSASVDTAEALTSAICGKEPDHYM